jgi:hypothetical protein
MTDKHAATDRQAFLGLHGKSEQKASPSQGGWLDPRGARGCYCEDATLEFLGGRPSQFLAKGTAGRTDRHA